MLVFNPHNPNFPEPVNIFQKEVFDFCRQWHLGKNEFLFHTSGSTGKPKPIHLTRLCMIESANMTKDWLNLQEGDHVLLCLPIEYIAGAMMLVRALVLKLNMVLVDPSQNPLEGIIEPIKIHLASFVTTQWSTIIQSNVNLSTFFSEVKGILIGGSELTSSVELSTKEIQLPIFQTYGMTETASQIATLKPDQFLQGKFNSGKILPHAKIIIDNQPGNINIQSQSLALGYYPQMWENRDNFVVDDIGFLDNYGYLHIIGRNSDKIITGGENVYPTEIESAIRKTNMVIDVCVIGITDKHWGQALTAIYIPKDQNISYLEIQTQLKNQLSKFKIPKHWISLPNLPRNAQGKINRQQLQQIAEEFIKTN
jgi:O-succinylbenzoic acid--CoA ligase